MKVLIACEFSGIVREAFRVKGHDAWSCDLLPTEIHGNHLQCDVKDILYNNWDLMIAHPPCTYLASSGARWWKDKQQEQQQAIFFVLDLLDAPIEKIAIENPIGCLPKHIGEPNQVIQPHWFGQAETKSTCLWLKGLPTLRATHRISVLDIKSSIHHESPSPNRWKNRSRTFTGIANAMADQWG